MLQVQPLYVPGWAWLELCEPRVVPLASNVLYYLLLVVSGTATSVHSVLQRLLATLWPTSSQL
jgi:hypothetical protein